MDHLELQVPWATLDSQVKLVVREERESRVVRVYLDHLELRVTEVHQETFLRSLDLSDHQDRLETAELRVFLVWTARKENEVTVVNKDPPVFLAGMA